MEKFSYQFFSSFHFLWCQGKRSSRNNLQFIWLLAMKTTLMSYDSGSGSILSYHQMPNDKRNGTREQENGNDDIFMVSFATESGFLCSSLIENVHRPYETMTGRRIASNKVLFGLKKI